MSERNSFGSRVHSYTIPCVGGESGLQGEKICDRPITRTLLFLSCDTLSSKRFSVSHKIIVTTVLLFTILLHADSRMLEATKQSDYAAGGTARSLSATFPAARERSETTEIPRGYVRWTRCSDFVIATRSRGAADRTSGMMLRCMVKFFLPIAGGASRLEDLFPVHDRSSLYIPKGAKTLNFPRIEAEARARHRHRNGHQKARCKHRPTKTFFELTPFFSCSFHHHLTPSEFVEAQRRDC